jgi:hypothetical protein
MTPVGAEYEYSKFFVQTNDSSRLLDLILGLGGHPTQGTLAEINDVELEIRPNPDVGIGPLDDFLFWPLIIEVSGEDASDGDAVVDVVGIILRELWSREIPAVVACQFESALPWSGGIERWREMQA